MAGGPDSELGGGLSAAGTLYPEVLIELSLAGRRRKQGCLNFLGEVGSRAPLPPE